MIQRLPIECLPVANLEVFDSPRLQGENPEHTKMLAGVEGSLPPIIVHRGTMKVLDGAHRLSAARLRGDEYIQARIFDGTEQEAFVLGVKANIAHGLPLSTADRSTAAERIIASHPSWSDRTIASATGLSARTIGTIRGRMEQEQGLREVAARVGQDGRIRPLDGAVGRHKAVKFIQENPNASLREVARHAGVSPSTVRDVRNRLQRGENPIPATLNSANAVKSTLPREEIPTDLETMLTGLKKDPSLRFSESGRTLLRWLYTHAVVRGDWEEMVEKIPPHCLFILVDFARRCADEWQEFGNTLEGRAVELAG